MSREKTPTIVNQIKPETGSIPRLSLSLDVVRYEKMLNDCDLTEEQRQDYLETLWTVIVGFVDLGFDIHPLQQATPEACGQELDLSAFMASNVIASKKGISQKQFTDAAECSDEHDAERMES